MFRSVLVGVDALPVAAPGLAAAIDQHGPTARTRASAAFSTQHLTKSRGTTGLEPLFTSHHTGVLKTMAVGGHGFAWLPRSAIMAELDRRDLVLVRDLARRTIALDIRLFRPTARLCCIAESF